MLIIAPNARDWRKIGMGVPKLSIASHFHFDIMLVHKLISILLQWELRTCPSFIPTRVPLLTTMGSRTDLFYVSVAQEIGSNAKAYVVLQERKKLQNFQRG